MKSLFNSTVSVHFLPCGHALDANCYTKLLQKSAPRCPLCKKYVADMSRYDNALKREIAMTPMPAPYDSWVSIIDCNECGKKSVVPFHLFGHFCSACHSSNTAVLSKRPREPDDPPAEPLEFEEEEEEEEEGGDEEEVDDDENGDEDDDDDDEDSDDDDEEGEGSEDGEDATGDDTNEHHDESPADSSSSHPDESAHPADGSNNQ